MLFEEYNKYMYGNCFKHLLNIYGQFLSDQQQHGGDTDINRKDCSTRQQRSQGENSLCKLGYN